LRSTRVFRRLNSSLSTNISLFSEGCSLGGDGLIGLTMDEVPELYSILFCTPILVRWKL